MINLIQLECYITKKCILPRFGQEKFAKTKYSRLSLQGRSVTCYIK